MCTCVGGGRGGGTWKAFQWPSSTTCHPGAVISLCRYYLGTVVLYTSTHEQTAVTVPSWTDSQERNYIRSISTRLTQSAYHATNVCSLHSVCTHTHTHTHTHTNSHWHTHTHSHAHTHTHTHTHSHAHTHTGMSQYIAAARAKVSSAQMMLSLSEQDMEKKLGISNSLHRRKLRLALDYQKAPDE